MRQQWRLHEHYSTVGMSANPFGRLVQSGALWTPRTGPDGRVGHRTFQPCTIPSGNSSSRELISRGIPRKGKCDRHYVYISHTYTDVKTCMSEHIHTYMCTCLHMHTRMQYFAMQYFAEPPKWDGPGRFSVLADSLDLREKHFIERLNAL